MRERLIKMRRMTRRELTMEKIVDNIKRTGKPTEEFIPELQLAPIEGDAKLQVERPYSRSFSSRVRTLYDSSYAAETERATIGTGIRTASVNYSNEISDAISSKTLLKSGGHSSNILSSYNVNKDSRG